MCWWLWNDQIFATALENKQICDLFFFCLRDAKKGFPRKVFWWGIKLITVHFTLCLKLLFFPSTQRTRTHTHIHTTLFSVTLLRHSQYQQQREIFVKKKKTACCWEQRFPPRITQWDFNKAAKNLDPSTPNQSLPTKQTLTQTSLLRLMHFLDSLVGF